MNEKTFGGAPAFLLNPERVAAVRPALAVNAVLADTCIISVLDIGCGSGLFAKEFADRGLTVSGIDLRPEMIAASRKNVPVGDFREASFDTLPFDDNAFDLAFLGFVLHESDDITVTLAEAKRVARKRIAVYEWPYAEGTVGPPRDHRLQAEQIGTAARGIGCSPLPTVDINGQPLYLLDR